MSNIATPEEIQELLRAGGFKNNIGKAPAPKPVILELPKDELSRNPGGAPSAFAPGGAPKGAAKAPSNDNPLIAAIEAAKLTGKVGYVAGNPIAFPFKTPADMFLFFYPELTPSEWQLEESMRLAGYLNLEDPDHVDPQDPTSEAPLLYNLVAANGSGKDTYILAPFALWFISANVRSRIISTSATQDQLKLQTFKPIVDYAERVNERLGFEVFEIKEFHIFNTLTGSELVGRVTNVPGRVEGFHPFSSPPGCKMAVVVNEAKSIEDDVYASFSRFTGYSHWIQVSSPGQKSGQFYRSCSIASDQECKLGEQWKRHVTAFECSHISRVSIEQLRLLHGEDSYIYITGTLAQFYSSSVDVVIPPHLLSYPTPPHKTFGLEPVAGLDIAFSTAGDASQFSLWHGNKEIHKAEIRTDSADRIHTWIIDQIRIGQTLGLRPENVYADGGGLGKPIISRVVEAGYPITTRRNEMPAAAKNYYENLGAEMYFRVKRLFEQRVLVQPFDKLAFNQLTERKAKLSDDKQKFKLEPKGEAKGRLGYSPDRADAIVLALSGYPLDVMLGLVEGPARPALQRFMSPDEFAQYAADYAFNNVTKPAESSRPIRGISHQFIIYADRRS